MTRAQLLLTSTLAGALAGGALLLAASPALAQTPPAPNQLPAGLRVVAGQASAAAQGNTLQVTQRSGRAALDWSSFNIGSRATVRFQDPSAQAMTLNRVSGPGASVIAGHLTSNGQLVLINQSGVVFMPGAVVDAQSVVVSASGITEAGMRQGVATGRFALDQPAHPGARIVNSGRISVRRSGLAALVAPQVANHGTISAPFGTVSLAGVSSHVVDLYGDGLLSIDVSRQTLQGSGGQAALVTNDGVIAAEGGRVALSTAAVDGIVTNLVEAGGSISADSAGRRGGTVLIDAEGGAAEVTGSISARGAGRGRGVGGDIMVMASGQVGIASGARIDASGNAGGGTVAIGTTLARARGGVGTIAPAAGQVAIAAGATLRADAIAYGSGGRVTVLSTDSTIMAGNLSARGGALSGGGGQVEVSGYHGLALTGGVDVSGPRGRAGALTIDPGNLTIETQGATGFNPPGTVTVGQTDPDAIISPSLLEGFNGDIHLIADQNIVVAATFTLTAGHDLTMQATNGSILINQSFANNGGISLSAGAAIIQAAGAAIQATGAGGFIAMSAKGAITLAADVAASASVNFATAASVTQNGGSITTPSLFSSGGISGAVSLNSAGNSVASIGDFNVAGAFSMNDAAPLVTVGNPITATGGPITITASAGALAVNAAVSTVGAGIIALSAASDITLSAPVTAADALNIAAGTQLLGGGALTQLAGGTLTSSNSAIALGAGGPITLDGAVSATNAAVGSVNITNADGVQQNSGSAITTPALFSSSQNGLLGNFFLRQSGNRIDRLGSIFVSGSFALVDSAPLLTVAGEVFVAPGQILSLTAPALTIEGEAGSLSALGGTVNLGPASGAVTLGAAGGGFSLTQSDLAGIHTGLLRIGGTPDGLASSVTVAGGFATSATAGIGTLELDAGAGGIAVTGGPLVADTLLLATSGVVTQTLAAPTALVQAGTLASAGAVGGIELANQNNAIGVLGGITSAGSEINVASSGAMQLAGPISTGGGGLTLNAGGSISLTGAVDVGALSLTTRPSDTASDVVWTTPISATSISGNVAGSVSLIDSYTGTTTLGALSGGNSVTVATSGPLTTSGAVSAGAVTLAATGLLNIASAITGFTIDLSAGTLTEDAVSGSLNGLSGEGTFGELTSTGGIGGNATLLGANTLTLVQGFNVGGALALLNTQSLAIGSGVGAATASLHVTNGGSIEIDAPLAIPTTGTLVLQADNLVVTGGATFDVVANQTGTIALIALAPDSALQMALGGGAVSGGGTLAVSNANFLLGALRANTLQLGGLPDGTISATDIAIAGAAFPAGVTLLLDGTGSLTQTGALGVDALGGSLGGGMNLSGGGNAIGALDNFSVGGNATLVDAAASLTVAGAVTLTTGGVLEIAADHFGFGANGSLGAGSVAIGPLDPGHTVGIGDATGAYDIELGDLSRITAATLTVGDSLIPGAQVAASLVLAGNASFAGTLVLDAGAGGVAQSGGSLTAGVLAGSAAGGAFDVAGGTGNRIGALGAIQANAIDIADAIGVQVSGVVAAANGPLSLLAPSITVDAAGSLSASGGVLGLNTDALSATRAGAVADAGTVSIAPFSDTVLTVGPAAGGVDLSVVSASTIELGSNTNGIRFSGAVKPGAATLFINAANAPVTETTADSLTVGTLEGLAGSLSLPGGNAIGTLAGFTVGTGDLLLVDSGLTVTGPVVADSQFAPQTITLQTPSLALNTGASFDIGFNSPASRLVLRSDALTGAVNATVPGGTVLLERLTAGAQSFAQSGGITAGTLQLGGDDLSSTSLTLGNLANLSVTTLRLESSGAVTQTDSLVAPGGTLTGQAASVTLSSAGNVLADLGNFTTTAAGGFTLSDDAPLVVGGAVSAGAAGITLSDSALLGYGITLAAGSSLQGAALVLETGGGAGLTGVTQDPGGVVNAGALFGNVVGDVLLDGTANAIGAIGTLFVSGLLRLSDPVTLTQDSTGILIAGTLAGNFGADVRLGGATNAIANLGAITAAGTLALTDADPTLAGTVKAAQISLSVDGVGYAAGGSLFATGGTVEIAPRSPSVLNLGTAAGGAPFVAAGVLANVDAALLRLGAAGGRVTATGIAVNAPVLVSSAVATVDLEAAGPGLVTEAAGATFGLSGTLVGNTGAVALDGGANAIPTLGPYTVNGGGFSLTDGGNLAIEGDVAASGITLAVAGALSLDAGSLLAPGGTVDLTANGASEGAGIIVAATLDSSGTPSGNFVLAGANRVGTLGGWNASGALTLVDQSGEGAPPLLTVAGPVNVTALALRAASIALAGNVTASGAVDLSTTSGGVTQTGGTLSAGLLTSGAGVHGGSASFASGGNAVTALGPFAVLGGGFTLADAAPLGVIGSLSAGSVLLSDPAGMSVTAPITAPFITLRGGALAIGQGGLLFAAGGTVDVVASGATETGNGVIRAATLLSGGAPGGAFVLGGANSIDTLGAFQMAAGGTLLLADTTGLVIAGPVAAAAVDLSTSAGGIAETTGGITAGVLSSSFGIAGGATLDSAGNAVAALGNIAVTSGDFSFAQAGSLAVAGGVGAANVAIRIGGALRIGGAGVLQANGTVDISAVGATEAASGVIAAPVLDSTQGAAGLFALTGANQIVSLGVFADPGGALALTDTQGLSVNGPVAVGGLTLLAPGVTLAGDVSAQAMQDSTTVAGIDQIAGALSVGTLSSPQGVAGPVSLGAANRIAALGALAARGPIALNDLAGLDIAGAVSTPGAVSLSVAGALSESAQGGIATPLLSGHAATAQLTQAANAIGTLDFATTAGGLALVDQQGLTIAALSGAGASLTVRGDLVLAGPVDETGATVLLDVSGAVAQVGGALSAGLLEGSAASIALPAANAVAVLGNIAAPGGFTLANRSALAIAGAVQAALIDLSVASGGISEPSGALIGQRLVSSGGIVGDAVLAGANQIAAIGPLGDAGRFQFADTEALTVGNISAPILDLSTTAGGIAQDGPVVAGTLLSSFGVNGGARFDDPGNRIATLGPMAVTGGDLVLADIGNLTVAGPVSAPDVTLGVAGAITQAGDIVAPGTFSTDSLGPYQRTGGALAVGTLTGRAVGLADFGTSASVQRIGAFTVDDAEDGFPGASAFSNFSLSDATALTLAGPLASDYLRISATGTLIWSGDITTLGLPRFQQDFPTPTDPGTYLQVTPGANGSAQILQVGAVHIFSQDAAISTVRLQLPPTGGSINFNNLGAPTTDLLLFIGAGSATGRIDVGDLLVSGRLGGTDLTGTVRGLAGTAAARAAELAPFLSANYRLNSCPLQSVNCILLPIETVPTQNPLHDLAIGQARDELDDADVLLPNVAEQDY